MRKKLILGTLLTLSLLVVTVVATVAPTLANSPSKNTKFIGALAEINIQLPSNSSPPATPGGVANHPTTLRIDAYDLNRRSTLGAADELLIFIWDPLTDPLHNALTPVALITDNAANAAFWRPVYNGTYVAFKIVPPGIDFLPNVIQVGPKDLEVWDVASDTFWVNLTKPIPITLNNPGNTLSNFILPPMTLMFKATSDSFDDPFKVSLNYYPGASGYTLTRTGMSQFAGVRVDIPDWLGGGFRYEGTGHVYWRVTDTWTPP
jgi:hypothetical protein